jgi:protein-L-isoaspartate(D-aspartate) O-methyltransferase
LPGGRLLFPLQAEHSVGAMLHVTRPYEESDAWPARLLSGVVFIACEGGQNPEIAGRLDKAFRRGGAPRVRWLQFGLPRADQTVWLQGEGWALMEG